MVGHVRAGAPAGAVLLLAGLLGGCGTSEDGKAAEGTDRGAASAPSSAAPPGASSATPSTPSPPPVLPAALTSQRPDWKHCTAPEGGSAPGGDWRCALVDVPLDYARPDGDTIGIALIRKKARDKDRRLGSMLFNFGGPGGSGVSILPRAAESYGYGKLNSRYDLVSFDPRGVARSAGVVCRTDKKQESALQNVDLTPDTATEKAAFMKDATDFGAGCAHRSGKVLPYVGTSNAARDMDLIRQVLGDEKLTYFGISYGTELGGTYAHLFPAKV